MKVRTSNNIIYSRIGAWRLLGPQEEIGMGEESADTSAPT